MHVLSRTQGGTTQSNQHVIEDLETAVRKVQDEAARMVSQGGRTVLIISVAEYKTGREGHTKLLLSMEEYKRLQQCLKCVQPLPSSCPIYDCGV